MVNKNLEYYMSLPYTFTVQRYDDESGSYYVSKVLELDGCHSDGKTKEEALENLREALELRIETGIEYGDSIPEPLTENAFSGKFTLRLPKTLHHRLTLEAKQEGVSLNQYALYKLSQ